MQSFTNMLYAALDLAEAELKALRDGTRSAVTSIAYALGGVIVITLAVFVIACGAIMGLAQLIGWPLALICVGVLMAVVGWLMTRRRQVANTLSGKPPAAPGNQSTSSGDRSTAHSNERSTTQTAGTVKKSPLITPPPRSATTSASASASAVKTSPDPLRTPKIKPASTAAVAAPAPAPSYVDSAGRPARTSIRLD